MYHTLEKIWAGGTFAIPLFIFCPPTLQSWHDFCILSKISPFSHIFPGCFPGVACMAKRLPVGLIPKQFFIAFVRYDVIYISGRSAAYSAQRMRS